MIVVAEFERRSLEDDRLLGLQRLMPGPHNPGESGRSCPPDSGKSFAAVFANIVDAQLWPSWYPNSHNVVVHDSPDNKLHEGTKFTWDTFGVHIETTVHELVPNSRIGWWGLGTGMKAYHTFLLVKTGQGCHIITEEVVRGEGAIKFRQEQPNAMHDGHDLWLKVIKERSEKQN